MLDKEWIDMIYIEMARGMNASNTLVHIQDGSITGGGDIDLLKRDPAHLWYGYLTLQEYINRAAR